VQQEHEIIEIYYVWPGTRQTHHKTMKQYIKPRKS